MHLWNVHNQTWKFVPQRRILTKDALFTNSLQRWIQTTLLENNAHSMQGIQTLACIHVCIQISRNTNFTFTEVWPPTVTTSARKFFASYCVDICPTCHPCIQFLRKSPLNWKGLVLWTMAHKNMQTQFATIKIKLTCCSFILILYIVSASNTFPQYD